MEQGNSPRANGIRLKASPAQASYGFTSRFANVGANEGGDTVELELVGGRHRTSCDVENRSVVTNLSAAELLRFRSSRGHFADRLLAETIAGEVGHELVNVCGSKNTASGLVTCFAADLFSDGCI